jgi:hypothetical protein
MSEEIKESMHPEKSPQLISRREFTLGSVALLGSYSLAGSSPLPPLSDEDQAIKLEKNQEIQELLDIRHITDDDLKRVIAHAEKTEKKLYLMDGNRFLSKLRILDTYFYAEYSLIEKNSFRIHSAYAHRFLIVKEPA